MGTVREQYVNRIGKGLEKLTQARHKLLNEHVDLYLAIADLDEAEKIIRAAKENLIDISREALNKALNNGDR